MKIVTVSREFGSGGRELGKRLAEQLGFDYYDREILTAIAQKCDVSENYAEYLLNHSFPASATISMRHSFHIPELAHSQVKIMREQTELIREIAAKGRDFVIVGRNADLILKEYRPYNIFVTADEASKLKRCVERASPEEKMSEKEMLADIREIDRARRKNRELISDLPWGDRRAYHLIVNTSGQEVKTLTAPVAALASLWFQTK